MPRRSIRSLPLSLAIAFLLTVPAGATEPLGEPNNLSLEDLLQVEVTSVSRKPQHLATVAASIHIITAEDILLSGANSIAEVLRLAPGVDATRLSGDRWSVSTRGFANQVANKLLVLVDGRNAYNPAFSGVFWQDFRFPLEDIERIEVIRGPASAVWGSNGVNGVINIITKSAAATQGGQVVAGAGNTEGEFGRAIWGGTTGDGSTYYRTYASSQFSDGQQAIPSMGGGDGHDANGHMAAGLRADGYLSSGAHWDLSADFFDDRADTVGYAPTALGDNKGIINEKHRGAPLRFRYASDLADGSSLQFEASYAHTEENLPSVLADLRDTLDVDLHHRFHLGDRHDVVWGGDYRMSSDSMKGTPTMHLNYPSRLLNYYAFFAQDEIRLLESLRLVLGARVEHNDMTDWTTQPTARVSWFVSASQTLWGALSEAYRAPSRGEEGFAFDQSYSAVGPSRNVLVVLHGGDNFGNERLRAAETGLRSQWTSNFATDAVIFEHRYDDLRTIGAPTYDFGHLPFVIANVTTLNGGRVTLDGAELSASWRVTPAWQLHLAQTWNDEKQNGSATVFDACRVPKYISSLRASWAPKKDINVDGWLRYTDARHSPFDLNVERKAFSSADLRVAWRPGSGLELSVTGQNLASGECHAYSGVAVSRENLNIIPTCQPRSVIGLTRLTF